MKKLLEERGTNLISLVILVIVLLVVITVLSVVIFGENGTRDNNKVKKYTEDLKQKLFEAKVNSLNNAGDLIEELATVIKNDGKYEDSEINKESDRIILVIEGKYKMEITKYEVTYIERVKK